MENKKTIRLIGIKDRWQGQVDFQKKTPSHYKLYKKGIDDLQKDVDSISHAIKALEAQDRALEELPEKKKFPKWCTADRDNNERGEDCPDTCEECVYGKEFKEAVTFNQAIDTASKIIAKDKRTIAELQEKVTAQQEKIRGLEEELAEGVE